MAETSNNCSNPGQHVCLEEMGGECSDSSAYAELCGLGGQSCKDFCANFGCVYERL